MCKLVCRRLWLCAFFLCCLTARAAQRDVPSFIRPAHRAALRGFLKAKPHLRVATFADADEHGKSVLGGVNGGEYGEGKNNSPFYAVGDFNHDGREDFAIAFVNTRSPKEFPVAIFNGPFRSKRSFQPAFYNEKRFGSYDFLLAIKDDNGRDELQVSIPGGDWTVMIKPRRRGRGYYVWEGMTE
ncbi:MAG TPA: hypothetical protein VJ715_05250 [Pyrinomonadaceae bacterium]|nr:hypothetical protein [Pyrinomonadaceae bacterium]